MSVPLSGLSPRAAGKDFDFLPCTHLKATKRGPCEAPFGNPRRFPPWGGSKDGESADSPLGRLKESAEGKAATRRRWRMQRAAFEAVAPFAAQTAAQRAGHNDGQDAKSLSATRRDGQGREVLMAEHLPSLELPFAACKENAIPPLDIPPAGGIIDIERALRQAVSPEMQD